MDIVRQKKTSWFKQYQWWFVAALAAGFILITLKYAQSQEFSVDSERVSLADVQRGELSIKVRGPGVLTPRDIRWISSSVEGRADKVLVKPGATVKAGELLFVLDNPQLLRQLEETQWELEALEAETIAAEVALDTQLLDQKALLLDARLNHESASMRLKAEDSLIKKGTQAVSKIEYEKTKLEVTQFKERFEIEKQRLVKVADNIEAQKNALNARVNKMRKTLQRVQEQVANLEVRASMNSVVQDVAIEVGQQVTLGSNLAKLARQDDLIAELQIPELAIRDVALNQKVFIDTRNNVIEGEVIRIAPSVSNGSVQVDVAFTQALSSDARPDLSVDGEILVTKLVDTTFVRRPSFIQSERVSKVYRFNSQSGIAEKVSVHFGKGSVQFIEIREGLKPGDQIIVSDISDFERFEKISIN